MTKKDIPTLNIKNKSWKKSISNFFSRIPHDRDTLIEILRAAEKRNIIDPDALIMIEGALQVSKMQVRDIMVPRVQMIVIKSDADPLDIHATVVESGHSRFPVIGGDTDQVLGILLAKDLLGYFSSEEEIKFDIKDTMRPAVFVPESKRLNILLREFRANRNHMAIVVDEYSGTSGLVTIEDVLEEIVGEIEDEHDIDEEIYIESHGRNRFTVRAITPIDEFNEYFHASLSTEEYDTIGGLILNAFGHVPKRGELLEYEGFNIKILRADQRRIQLMRIKRIDKREQRVVNDNSAQ